jgi:hypothetical protein
MNPTCTFSHQKTDMLVQNGSIRMHFGQRKYTYKLSLGRVHSQFTSGNIKEWFLNITWSKYKELSSETVICFRISLSHQFKKNAMVCCPLVCACIMIMPILIQPIILWDGGVTVSIVFIRFGIQQFWPLKDALHGRHFGSDEEVK